MQDFFPPLTLLSGLFLLFATALVGSSLGVVCARNPVHAVLFLILAFFNAAGLFLMLGAEFLAMVLVVVYVGAVAVLFLFVVMMLQTNPSDSMRQALKSSFRMDRPTLIVGGGCLAMIVLEVIALGLYWHRLDQLYTPSLMDIDSHLLLATEVSGGWKGLPNATQLGLVLYTDYFWLFQICGLILLVAMVGAILLVFRGKQEKANSGRHPNRTRPSEDNPKEGKSQNPHGARRHNTRNIGFAEEGEMKAGGKKEEETKEKAQEGLNQDSGVPAGRKRPASLKLTQPPIGKGLAP